MFMGVLKSFLNVFWQGFANHPNYSSCSGLNVTCVRILCRNLKLNNSITNQFSDTSDASKKSRYRQKATEYMDRAELLSKQIESEKAAGKFHEQVQFDLSYIQLRLEVRICSDHMSANNFK